MVLKSYGTFEQLRGIVNGCGMKGFWRHIEKNNQYQFKAATGENMNWWPQAGTINFQGGSMNLLQDYIIHTLTGSHQFKQIESYEPSGKKKSRTNSNGI